MIQTLYQTFTHFHMRLVRHLYFLRKLPFMSAAAEAESASNFIASKC